MGGRLRLFREIVIKQNVSFSCMTCRPGLKPMAFFSVSHQGERSKVWTRRRYIGVCYCGHLPTAKPKANHYWLSRTAADVLFARGRLSAPEKVQREAVLWHFPKNASESSTDQGMPNLFRGG